MRRFLLLTTVLAFVLTSSAWAADISGNWTLKMAGPQGEEVVPMVIKVSGENLTITATHPNFQEMTGTGTLKGNEISFNLKSQMEFKFTGTVTGNKMSGTREMSMGEGGARGGASGGEAGGGAPGGQQGGAPGGEQGGAPGGQEGGAPGGQQGGGGQSMSNEWTAEKN